MPKSTQKSQKRVTHKTISGTRVIKGEDGQSFEKLSIVDIFLLLKFDSPQEKNCFRANLLNGLLLSLKHTNIQKTNIMASGSITSWEIDGETVEAVSDFPFGGLQNHCRW